MDAIDSVFDPLREFAKDSVRLVKRCHKPDRKEFSKVAVRTAIGFVVMGFVGFFVKLIFIPINNIIVGSGLQILQSTEKSLRFQGDDGGKIAWLSVEFSGRRFLSGLLMFDSLGMKSTRELTMLKSSRTWNLSSSNH
ncbi:Protein translocase complex, SecE/Sec61-gamma subunit [Sesbania bispinosa]|nr:Protein translocase complex, SecE/Sec61-gamma subunit [Sesbania bispinosa]